MNDQPYMSEQDFGAHGIGILADQVQVGRLRPTKSDSDDLGSEWTLTAQAPAFYRDVAFEAESKQDAINKAKEWLLTHFEREPSQRP